MTEPLILVDTYKISNLIKRLNKQDSKIPHVIGTIDNKHITITLSDVSTDRVTYPKDQQCIEVR